ncbi:phosphotriesterase-related protein isoform X2 [Plodia interpunctella]|uniref:phosphotriesterase-related protein isoform X2 n=1 Tax=Plodia interpunctella TaxID=58824 RepID=UPI002367ED74|nr:phosphotriesterase-related protein [Plodia interpunctella]
MAGKVQTVLGDVTPDQLGHTLTHEHLAMNFSYFYTPPPEKIADQFQDTHMGNVGYIRQYPYSSQFNLELGDQAAKDAVLQDVKMFKRSGGGTIVENSTEGLQRAVGFYKRVSQDTSVHIVAGSGYYIADIQPKLSHISEEVMYERMLNDMTEGFEEDSSVKAGFLGEIASGWPLKDFERRAIKAAGQVQLQLGCPVSFHPHRLPDAPFEIIRLYLEAGGKPDKAVMSHLDRTLQDESKLLDFSDLGTYCQFDLFGTEVSYYQLNPSVDMPSDAQRLDRIAMLVREGRSDRVLMSHDIHTKHRLAAFGGHGYSHIINNVVPRMPARGFADDVIQQITVLNPATWLTMN